MKKLFIIIIRSLSILTLGSCINNKFLIGTYRNNISPFNLSWYEISFKNDGVCNYQYTFNNMQGTKVFDGKYIINNGKLYIKLDKPKDTINNNPDRDNWISSITDEYNSFKLKNENEIEYHFKYLIRGNKLFVYRVDNGKLVNRVSHFNSKKGRHMAKYYLRKD